MLKTVKDLENRFSYLHLWGMKIMNTILYDKRHRAQPMKVKRNSKRKASDSQHKVDALVNWYSHRIAEATLRERYEAKATCQREARREARRAKREAKAMHA